MAVNSLKIDGVNVCRRQRSAAELDIDAANFEAISHEKGDGVEGEGYPMPLVNP